MNEEYLRLVRLSIPSTRLLERILSTATKCVERTRGDEKVDDLEAELDLLIIEALGLKGTETECEVIDWARQERARDA